ncbi:sugar phosphate isomerase/epimerase family protein [Oceanomicrobium pacificus]|uniref:TIM barrel protein n=1 Tax=Oceanomicrobium pacificus TaxID=2692916 RepID=A0A6B0TY60_9RHOB|nr:sugar phosphate isomerase/epimerase family protein [Oceanomicrobium pacificus]MXU66222.1 TIM barrel protein [Oceanomicrobium pacificus]
MAEALQVSLCNELLADEGLSVDAQCEVAAALGYMGLELALGSLVPRPHEMTDAEADALRARIEGHGLQVTGLHWLLAPYPDLSITDPDRQAETGAVLDRLITLCARLGGTVLVHGSPAQRRAVDGEDPARTRDRLAAFFAPRAERAASDGVTYCIEPLSPAETDVITTVAEGADLVDAVGSPAFRTMIDTSAAGQGEDWPVADLIRQWVPDGRVAHIQANDTNRGAPGTGQDPFPAIMAALRASGWSAPVAVEPFRTTVSASVTAAIGAATLRTAWEAAA